MIILHHGINGLDAQTQMFAPRYMFFMETGVMLFFTSRVLPSTLGDLREAESSSSTIKAKYIYELRAYRLGEGSGFATDINNELIKNSLKLLSSYDTPKPIFEAMDNIYQQSHLQHKIIHI